MQYFCKAHTFNENFKLCEILHNHFFPNCHIKSKTREKDHENHSDIPGRPDFNALINSKYNIATFQILLSTTLLVTLLHLTL